MMLYGFKHTLSNILSILDSHNVPAHYIEEDGHFYIHTNNDMQDAGLCTANIMLDVFFDENCKVLFIGLLRLPRHVRKLGLARKIVNELKQYADSKEFTIFVDSCDDCYTFWGRQGLKILFKDQCGFDIMGYNSGMDSFKDAWKNFKTTHVFIENLMCHNK